MDAHRVIGSGAEADLVAYKMDKAYASGTRFRFFVTTDTEAYIYAFRHRPHWPGE